MLEYLVITQGQKHIMSIIKTPCSIDYLRNKYRRMSEDLRKLNDNKSDELVSFCEDDLSLEEQLINNMKDTYGELNKRNNILKKQKSEAIEKKAAVLFEDLSVDHNMIKFSHSAPNSEFGDNYKESVKNNLNIKKVHSMISFKERSVLP